MVVVARGTRCKLIGRAACGEKQSLSARTAGSGGTRTGVRLVEAADGQDILEFACIASETGVCCMTLTALASTGTHTHSNYRYHQ
jgi:hypothetical protein